jgi:hypothetical protein
MAALHSNWRVSLLQRVRGEREREREVGEREGVGEKGVRGGGEEEWKKGEREGRSLEHDYRQQNPLN